MKRATVPVVTRPAPRPIPRERLAELRCKAHSGLAEPAEMLEVLDYVGLLEASLLGRRDRLAMSGEDLNGY